MFDIAHDEFFLFWCASNQHELWECCFLPLIILCIVDPVWYAASTPSSVIIIPSVFSKKFSTLLLQFSLGCSLIPAMITLSQMVCCLTSVMLFFSVLIFWNCFWTRFSSRCTLFLSNTLSVCSCWTSLIISSQFCILFSWVCLSFISAFRSAIVLLNVVLRESIFSSISFILPSNHSPV